MKGLFLIVFAALIAGCARIPGPNVRLPQEYAERARAEENPEEEMGNLSLFWQQFDDPLLDQLVQEALSCSYDLQIAYEKIVEARGTYQVEFSRLLPHVDGTAFATRTRNSATLADSSFLGSKFVNLFVAGFDAAWELDFFGKNRDAKRASYANFLAANETAKSVYVSLISEVVDTYIAIRALQQRIVIAQHHKASETQFVSIATARAEVGLVTYVDPLRAEGLYQERIEQLYLLDILLQTEIYRLAVLLGRPPEEFAGRFQEPEPIPFAKDRIPVGLPCELLRRRPDIRRAEYELEAAGARLLVAKKELLPTISLTGLQVWATGSYPKIFGAESRNWTIGPSILWPLFDAGRIRGNIVVHSSKARQAVLNYEQTVIEALQDVETSLVSYFQEGPRIEALVKEVSAIQEARNLSKVLYTNGISSFDTVIEIERDLFEAEIVLINSKERMMNSLIAVYKAIGGGWQCSDLL